MDILNKILEIKTWEGSKGKRNYRIKMKKLRKELYGLFPQNQIHLVIDNFVLEKQYNPVLKKEYIAIYDKTNWYKREEFFKNKF